jgi:preprotein translocase subunit YajC
VITIFWGFLLVAVALAVLAFVGRRRQRTARAKAAQQRADSMGTGRAARRSGGGQR